MKKELNLMTKLHFDEIIDHSLSLYKQHFVYVIKIMAFFYVPGIILFVLAAAKFTGFYAEIMERISNPSATAGPEELLGHFGTLMYYTSLLSLLFILLNMLAGAAVIRGIDEKIAGRDTREGEVALFTLKKTLPLAVTTLIAMIMMGAGFLFCIIPFFIFAVYLLFIPQTLMIEDRWGFGAVGRSFSLVNGHFWPTFLIPLIYFLAYTFIASVISYAILLTPYIDLVKNIISNQGQTSPDFMARFYSENAHLIIIQNVVTNIINLLMSPILHIALTLKFLNIRNLKEGTALVNEIRKEKNPAL